jgi:hypothetical protein
MISEKWPSWVRVLTPATARDGAAITSTGSHPSCIATTGSFRCRLEPWSLVSALRFERVVEPPRSSPEVAAPFATSPWRNAGDNSRRDASIVCSLASSPSEPPRTPRCVTPILPVFCCLCALPPAIVGCRAVNRASSPSLRQDYPGLIIIVLEN